MDFVEIIKLVDFLEIMKIVDFLENNDKVGRFLRNYKVYGFSINDYVGRFSRNYKISIFSSKVEMIKLIF